MDCRALNHHTSIPALAQGRRKKRPQFFGIVPNLRPPFWDIFQVSPLLGSLCLGGVQIFIVIFFSLRYNRKDKIGFAARDGESRPGHLRPQEGVP